MHRPRPHTQCGSRRQLLLIVAHRGAGILKVFDQLLTSKSCYAVLLLRPYTTLPASKDTPLFSRGGGDGRGGLTSHFKLGLRGSCIAPYRPNITLPRPPRAHPSSHAVEVEGDLTSKLITLISFTLFFHSAHTGCTHHSFLHSLSGRGAPLFPRRS